MKSKDLHAWTRVKLQECYHDVKQEDAQRKSIVQQMLQKSARVRLPAQTEGPEQRSWQRGPQRGEGVSGRSPADLCVRLSRVRPLGGDNLVHVLVEDLQEQSRLKMDASRRFIKVGSRRLGEVLGGAPRGRTQVEQRRFPISSGGRTDTSKR